MAKSIKLGSDTYLDSTAVVHNMTPLSSYLNALNIKDIVAYHHTTPSGSYSDVLAAHSGVGKTITVPVPAGYTLLAHVACWGTGSVGLLAGFDAYSATQNVNVYISNTLDRQYTISPYFQVHVLSLYKKTSI